MFRLGMWERTVTIGSAGKTFSSTGAKVNFFIIYIFFLIIRHLFQESCL